MPRSEGITVAYETTSTFKEDGNSVGERIAKRDHALIHKLHQLDGERGSNPVSRFGLPFRNTELAVHAQASYTSADLSSVNDTLKRNGTLDIHLRNGKSVAVGGKDMPIVTVAATETQTNGDMSEMVWIRDQTQAGRSLLELWKQDPQEFSQEGKEARDILLSTTHLMSTDAQLGRFTSVMQSADADYKADTNNWPQIAVRFDRLDSAEPTEWRHKQDAWQMLGISMLDALDHGLIDPAELQENNKKFLGMMMPFLESVDFTTVESSGSWEELEAQRTSVIGVETALLKKIQDKAADPRFAFLREGYESAQTRKGTHDSRTFDEAIEGMLDTGLYKIGANLPDEASGYDPSSPKYRTADATLLYLLDYGIPQLLADKQIPIAWAGEIPQSSQQIEELILAQVGKLHDQDTQGIKRYGTRIDSQDTYLSTNYTTDGVQEQIKEMKRRLKEEAGDSPLDLDRKFAERQLIVPEGSAAAWTHFNPQISAWASRRYIKTGEEQYYTIATECYNRTLAMVTGENEHHSLPDTEGVHQVVPVEAYRLPECYLTMQTKTGEAFTVASPNVPLNWAVGKMIEASGILAMATRMREK